jgi:cellulose synthase/poly-beta-1,6-N-acetylglucosamine synthase-like glycosyltransferase
VRSRFAEWAGLDTKSMSFGVALTPESVDHRMLNPPELSVVMPCRNEEATVAACIEQICSTLENHIAGEIIVADNGSTDKSAEIALSPPTAATTSRRFLYFWRNSEPGTSW